YLQYSRIFYIISILTILVTLTILLNSCLPEKENVTRNFDLKVSMLSFIA
ncbi:Hypothetical predicted protein, partial [Marmota monax]